MTLRTSRWCYDQRHTFKFFNMCRTSTTYSAEIIIKSAVVHDMASSPSSYPPHFGCVQRQSKGTQLYTLWDNVMNPDTMLLSFPTCLGRPKLIQCSHDDYIGCSGCVSIHRVEQHDSGWCYEPRHDVVSWYSTAIMVISAVVNDRQWLVAPQLPPQWANISGLCVIPFTSTNDMIEHTSGVTQCITRITHK